MKAKLTIVPVLSVFVFVACGGSDGQVLGGGAYQPDSATVITDGKADHSIANTGACGDDTCRQVTSSCGMGQAADVIVGPGGAIAGIVCYDPKATFVDAPVDSVPSYTTDGNNTVLVLDGKDDGADIAGDLTVTGNNAVVYGSGPDTSIIGGTVDIQMNNAKVRGVRVKGDLTIDKNDTTLAYCVIEGNLTITGNNTVVAGCDVFGTVTITGMNTSFLGDRFAAGSDFSEAHVTCKDDVTFDDANANGVIDTAEIGAPPECGG